MSFDQLMQNAQEIEKKAFAAAQSQRAMLNNQKQTGGFVDPAAPYAVWQFEKEILPTIVPAFEPFSQMPDPANYDPLIDDLIRAMGQLNNSSAPQSELTNDVRLSNPDLDKMTTDGGYLQGWKGQAAIDFKANFVDNFKTLAGNQFTALSTMKSVLQAHQAMWAAARTDIDHIAQIALEALDNRGACTKSQWSSAFTVLSAVATVASAAVTIITAGATAPIVPIAAGAALGNLGVAAVTQKSGASVEYIINEMLQDIDTLRQHILDVEKNQIANNIPPLVDAFASGKSQLVAPRPSLAGMSLPDLTGDGGMGLPDLG